MDLIQHILVKFDIYNIFSIAKSDCYVSAGLPGIYSQQSHNFCIRELLQNDSENCA
jgi:hypothetical protein